MKIRLILSFNFLFAIVLAGNGSHNKSKDIDGELKVDGEYIMYHIQDDKVFELFNPFDWNDGNHDHYYYTSKVKLDQSWNKINNIPIISNYLNWMWDPSTDPFTFFPSDNQLIFSKQSIMMLLASVIIILLFIF